MRIVVRRNGMAGVVSLVLHAFVVLALLILPPDQKSMTAEIDLEMVERRPPPPPPEEPEPPPPPPPPPEPEPERPRPRPRVAPPPEPPPPEPPPEAPPPPDVPTEAPVFNMDSSSFANSGSFAMPSGPGNTRFGPIGKLRNPAARPERPAGVPGGTGTAAFVPAPPARVARGARVVREVRAPYPEQARDAGIEGVVLLQVEVTRTGAIHAVRVLTDPGYGLGAAAARALRGFRFAPAVDGGGDPIDSRFTYTYRFELDDF